MMPPPTISEEQEPGHSPEARRRLAVDRPGALIRMHGGNGPISRAAAIALRVTAGCYNDGFIHAGNLAYMAMLAIFPFFITGAAIFSAIGEEADRAATINAILLAVPPVVREVIEPVALSVIDARSGWFLWIGALFGLWTVGSLIETIRDILRRAYGTRPAGAFWKHRFVSTGIILAAMLVLILSLFAQVAIGAAQELIAAWFPRLENALRDLAWSRVIPGIGLLVSIHMLFVALAPTAYRGRIYPKWPGAVLVAVWWIGVTIALPRVLVGVFSYDLTYGSLAGMMIALFFFWLVGLGIVAGAELNAALAVTPEEAQVRRAIGAAEEENGI